MQRATCLGLLSLLLCIRCVCSIAPGVIAPQNLQGNSRFEWERLAPSTDLDYHECYDDFECARLSVPLDWQNDSNNNNVSLAVIRLPAAVAEDDPRHGGSILLNPGGPGGSGILYALQVSRNMQKLLDGPSHYYEIVSFDPRGVFYSTPKAFCFGTAFESEFWWREKRAAGNLDQDESTLRYHWAMELARGRVCADSPDGQFEDGDNLRRHLSTAYTARDMLQLVKKIDQCRRVLHDVKHPVQETFSVDPPTPKLNYIGGSYGTFLGQTFASMFPESVGRMVLDSNLDADNWVSSHEASVDDHEAIRDFFFETCFTAGNKCALRRDSDREPDDIRKRYAAISARLKDQPAAVARDGHVSVITEDELQWGFFTTLYQPLLFFERFSRFLNDLYNGETPDQPFWQHQIPPRDTVIDNMTSHILHNQEVAAAIHCSDGPDFSDGNLTSFKDHLNDLVTRFPNAGAIQSEYKISCWAWPKSLRTVWRYSGPFEGSVPILFVNNRLDPVAPLKNARKMAARFRGSRVLVQDSVGHGALWPAGNCMWRHVRSYIHDGTLPDDGSVCDFPCSPFEPACSKNLATEAAFVA